MSVLKRRKVFDSPMISETAERQESLRAVKIEAERLREKLQKTIIDSPEAAKKAALLISLWIEGKSAAKAKKR